MKEKATQLQNEGRRKEMLQEEKAVEIKNKTGLMKSKVGCTLISIGIL